MLTVHIAYIQPQQMKSLNVPYINAFVYLCQRLHGNTAAEMYFTRQTIRFWEFQKSWLVAKKDAEGVHMAAFVPAIKVNYPLPI